VVAAVVVALMTVAQEAWAALVAVVMLALRLLELDQQQLPIQVVAAAVHQ
jgi:hypothetical protein